MLYYVTLHHMARGDSGKIVLEIEPAGKEELYSAVKKDGMTMKEWFLRQKANYLGRSVVAESPATYGGRKPSPRSKIKTPKRSRKAR